MGGSVLLDPPRALGISRDIIFLNSIIAGMPYSLLEGYWTLFGSRL